MKLCFTLLILSLFVAACGSPDAAEPPATDEEHSIETSVAATVAAALGEGAPVAVAPTEPTISGNATPLTPIPRLEEPSAEVSPEVEYAEPAQNGELVFDFGQTAEPQPTATTPPAATPTRVSKAVIGGTVFTGIAPGDMPAAYTLSAAELVNSITDGDGNVIEANTGYQLLLVQLQLRNTGVQPLDTGTLRSIADNLPTYVMDLDNDAFPCLDVNEQVDDINKVTPPGHGIAYRLFCEIPVTANAEGLVGLRLINGGYDFPVHNFEFDLGQRESAAVDLAHLFEVMPRHTLPVSNADLCREEFEAPYLIESASWYDRPAATPDAGAVQVVTERYQNFTFPTGHRAESPEQAVALLTEYWNGLWSAYDFEALDLVAIRITRTNSTKGDLSAEWQVRSFALVSADPFVSTPLMGYVERADRLVNPLGFLDRSLPPGAVHQSTIYALVPENEAELLLLHQAGCNLMNNTQWYMIEFPREVFEQTDNLLSNAVLVAASSPEGGFLRPHTLNGRVQ